MCSNQLSYIAVSEKADGLEPSLDVDTTVEFGSKVLTGMVKRIDKDLATISLETPADLEAFGKGL